MIPLNQIEIAAPCHESWSEMDGNGAVRFCARCSRNVYNLSEMTTAQAQALVAETEGHLCVRFYQRSDGTMMTRDCPVGVRIARRRTATRSWAVSLTIASLMGTSLFAMSPGQATMGRIAMPAVKHAPAKPKSHVKPAAKPRSVKPPRVGAATPAPLMGEPTIPTRPPKPSPDALMGGVSLPPKDDQKR